MEFYRWSPYVSWNNVMQANSLLYENILITDKLLQKASYFSHEYIICVHFLLFNCDL